jgi:hypothetical protein
MVTYAAISAVPTKSPPVKKDTQTTKKHFTKNAARGISDLGEIQNPTLLGLR